MTIVESIKCVLQQNNDGLTSKQIYDEIIRQGLYSFGAENPVGVVNAQLRRRCIYALNKKDPNAIVYTDADGNLIRLTCDDFACAAEFRRWKDWSDSDLRKEENADHKQSDNSISLEVLSEEATAVVSIEDEYMEQISADEAAVLVRLLRQGLSSHLTETQRRRLWKYCVEGKPVRLIAKEECAYRNAVWKSIQAAKEKMFKFLVETGCAKPRFRRDR